MIPTCTCNKEYEGQRHSLNCAEQLNDPSDPKAKKPKKLTDSEIEQRIFRALCLTRMALDARYRVGLSAEEQEADCQQLIIKAIEQLQPIASG